MAGLSIYGRRVLNDMEDEPAGGDEMEVAEDIGQYHSTSDLRRGTQTSGFGDASRSFDAGNHMAYPVKSRASESKQKEVAGPLEQEKSIERRKEFATAASATGQFSTGRLASSSSLLGANDIQSEKEEGELSETSVSDEDEEDERDATGHFRRTTDDSTQVPRTHENSWPSAAVASISARKASVTAVEQPRAVIAPVEGAFSRPSAGGSSSNSHSVGRSGLSVSGPVTTTTTTTMTTDSGDVVVTISSTSTPIRVDYDSESVHASCAVTSFPQDDKDDTVLGQTPLLQSAEETKGEPQLRQATLPAAIPSRMEEGYAKTSAHLERRQLPTILKRASFPDAKAYTEGREGRKPAVSTSTPVAPKQRPPLTPVSDIHVRQNTSIQLSSSVGLSKGKVGAAPSLSDASATEGRISPGAMADNYTSQSRPICGDEAQATYGSSILSGSALEATTPERNSTFKSVGARKSVIQQDSRADVNERSGPASSNADTLYKSEASNNGCEARSVGDDRDDLSIIEEDTEDMESPSASSSSTGPSLSQYPSYAGRGMTNRPPGALRRGKWTPEEEDFAQRLMRCFKDGVLALPDGTTLRALLSFRLNCAPMRITKKFQGGDCIGRQVYHGRPELLPTAAARSSLAELERLEEQFLAKISNSPKKSRAERNAQSSSNIAHPTKAGGSTGQSSSVTALNLATPAKKPTCGANGRDNGPAFDHGSPSFTTLRDQSLQSPVPSSGGPIPRSAPASAPHPTSTSHTYAKLGSVAYRPGKEDKKLSSKKKNKVTARTTTGAAAPGSPVSPERGSQMLEDLHCTEEPIVDDFHFNKSSPTSKSSKSQAHMKKSLVAHQTGYKPAKYSAETAHYPPPSSSPSSKKGLGSKNKRKASSFPNPDQSGLHDQGHVDHVSGQYYHPARPNASGLTAGILQPVEGDFQQAVRLSPNSLKSKISGKGGFSQTKGKVTAANAPQGKAVGKYKGATKPYSAGYGDSAMASFEHGNESPRGVEELTQTDQYACGLLQSFQIPPASKGKSGSFSHGDEGGYCSGGSLSASLSSFSQQKNKKGSVGNTFPGLSGPKPVNQRIDYLKEAAKNNIKKAKREHATSFGSNKENTKISLEALSSPIPIEPHGGLPEDSLEPSSVFCSKLVEDPLVGSRILLDFVAAVHKNEAEAIIIDGQLNDFRHKTGPLTGSGKVSTGKKNPSKAAGRSSSSSKKASRATTASTLPSKTKPKPKKKSSSTASSSRSKSLGTASFGTVASFSQDFFFDASLLDPMSATMYGKGYSKPKSGSNKRKKTKSSPSSSGKKARLSSSAILA